MTNRPSVTTGQVRVRRSAGRTTGSGYLADFSWVRRQRVQTSAFFGRTLLLDDERLQVRLVAAVRSNAVHPDDWGLKPPIDSLPQIAQERAMRGPLSRDGVGCPSRTGANGAV